MDIWCGTNFLREIEILETVIKYSPKNFYKLKLTYKVPWESECSLEEWESFFER